MKKQHAAYAVLLVGALVGLVLLTGTPRPKTKAKQRSARGAPPTARSVQRASKTRLSGIVRRADGAPIKGATVFVLPKNKRGGIRDRLPHEVTGASGRWTLRARRVEESWIGVVAAGYRHAWVDGAKQAAGRPIEHTLERAPALKVKLVDADGKPIARKGVQLEPWPRRTTYFLPGPNARQGEQWKVTDKNGVATFRVGDAGAVTLKPNVEGFHCASKATWLAKPEGQVTLRMVPSLSLRLHLEATESKRPLRTLVTVDLHEEGTGRLALSYTDTPNADGILEIRRAIRPGTYHVHVHGEGRSSSFVPDLELDASDEPHVVSAGLALAPEPASLRLELGAGPAAGPGGRTRRAPLVYLFRPESMWRDHGWEPGAPESWDRTTGTLELELPAGRYHVLVADVLSRKAALVRDVGLAPGAEQAIEVAMRHGLRTSVNALIAAHGKTRRVEIAGVGIGDLPVYGITSDGRIRVSRSDDVLGRVDEGLGVYLGPYPVEAATVRVTGWDGGVVTHDVEK